MKPCSRNRKPLAWLAVGELDARAATALREHVKTCEGCRHYLAEISSVAERLGAAEMTPDIQASESFHRGVVARLGAEDSGSVWQALAAPLVAVRLNWRVALPVAGAAALVIALVCVLTRQPAAPVVAPTVVQAAPPRDLKGDLAPTIANYQRIASRSLDDFDELITKQSKRSPSAAPVYTASVFSSAQAVD